MNPKVEAYFEDLEQWKKEHLALRAIAIDCGLNEDFKWRQPCYTSKGKNIAIIGGFKDSCILSFFKGALLKDELGLLDVPGPNSREGRLFRFTNVEEINSKIDIIKAYIYEAIEIEEAGLKIEPKPKSEYEIPAELNSKFDEDPMFREAFEALTTGRQKAYFIHFAGAKQSKTRVARIENYKDRILRGFGFNDCVCGHSKRMPNCDGSHKYL